MGNDIGYFFWLLLQGLDGLQYAWPVTLFLIGLLIFFIQRTFKTRRLPFERGLFLSLIPMLFIPLMAALGTAYRNSTHSTPEVYTWPEYIVGYLPLVQIPLTLYLAIKLRSYRGFVISVSLLIFWFNFWASFVCGMAISGDWL